MSAWTRWQKIADRTHWYDDALDWEGPACYELGIAGPRGGDLRIVYCGETINEKRRIIAHASHGSHLSKIIKYHLKIGWNLFYRAQTKNLKRDAIRTQNALLAQFKYDWNIRLNTEEID
jgi:hypothetical protein